MAALPEQIGALTRLERLLAAQNALISLPSSFARLQALKVLSLAKNRFATVPDMIGECSNLEDLDLSGNCLQVGIICIAFFASLSVNCQGLEAPPLFLTHGICRVKLVHLVECILRCLCVMLVTVLLHACCIAILQCASNRSNVPSCAGATRVPGEAAQPKGARSRPEQDQ